MTNLLKDINIKNTRIEALDGKDSIHKYLSPNVKHNMSIYEIGCLLSHIKAISYLKNIEGNYFMICEDDITFDNIFKVDSDLENIIKNCPEFDILMLHKTNIFGIKNYNLYTKWFSKQRIYSASCYIINKKGIEKICNKIYYNEMDNNFIFNVNYIEVSDSFLYKNTETYFYRYNFINTLENESTIRKYLNINFFR